MARIAGTNIPDDKRIEVSLTYVKGIGRNGSKKILESLKINKDSKVKDLLPKDLVDIRNKIEKEFLVEGELRRKVLANIKRLKDIRCYKGIRHLAGLPCRGQRTRYNARTTRMLSGKKRKLSVAGSSMKKLKASASEKT